MRRRYAMALLNPNAVRMRLRFAPQHEMANAPPRRLVRCSRVITQIIKE